MANCSFCATHTLCS